MTRSIHGLGFALATALVLAGCSFTSDDGHGDGAQDSDGGSPSSQNQPRESSVDGGAPSHGIPFAPANVPADAALTASGDWIFNSDTCEGKTRVSIDTATGKVSCGGQAKGAFTFSVITQTDATFGTLTAALFVTRRLVIEPSMVVEVLGNRPLVIVALDTASIQGTLRATAEFGDQNLAHGGGFDGASGVEKGQGPGGGLPAMGRSGAGGGGHCGLGGSGIAAAGGKAYGAPPLVPLVGGSAGGGGNFGGGGGGGGAVQLAAGTSIEVTGIGAIDVAGGAGEFQSNAGGAGGGILLEAPLVSILGTLAANGGAGAGGRATSDGAHGVAGAEAALGGAGSLGAGAGGNGSAGAVVVGAPGAHPDPTENQGGGGGGAGRIRINTTSGSATIGANAVISPSLATACATQGTPTAR